VPVPSPSRWTLASGSSTDRRVGDFTLLNNFTTVPDLRNPLDPAGWPDFTETSGPQSRRSRRIDLWLEEPGAIAVDSAFQDSAMHPQEGRIAIHEYALSGAIDRASGELAWFEPGNARFLPRLLQAPGTRELRAGWPAMQSRTGLMSLFPKTSRDGRIRPETEFVTPAQ